MTMQSSFNMNFATRKQKKWLVRGLTLLAILCLLAVLGNGLYRAYDTYKDRKKAQQNAPLIERPTVKSEYSIDTVISTRLFGEQQVKKVVVELPKVAPETKLDISLEGLLSATNAVIARAIISVKKKKGGLYKVGDEIEGANATLEEIRPDGVLLNRNGVIENLAFIKKTVSGNRAGNSFGGASPSANPGFTPRTRNQGINRSRPTNNDFDQARSSGRRAVKRPNFKGLDAAIERELEEALEELERD